MADGAARWLRPDGSVCDADHTHDMDDHYCRPADGAADPLADVRARHEEYERFIAGYKRIGEDAAILRRAYPTEEDRTCLLAALDAERAARREAEAAITRAQAVPEGELPHTPWNPDWPMKAAWVEGYNHGRAAVVAALETETRTP